LDRASNFVAGYIRTPDFGEGTKTRLAPAPHSDFTVLVKSRNKKAQRLLWEPLGFSLTLVLQVFQAIKFFGLCPALCHLLAEVEDARHALELPRQAQKRSIAVKLVDVR
jgi:hypothetical protein